MKSMRMSVLGVAVLFSLGLSFSAMGQDNLLKREQELYKRFAVPSRPTEEPDQNQVKVRWYSDLAQTAIREKDLKAANHWLSSALELDPRNLQGLVTRAWIFNETGDFDDARKHCVAALEIDDKNADAWRECGYALFMQDQLEYAKAALTKAVELNPRDRVAPQYLDLTMKKLQEMELRRQGTPTLPSF